MTEQEQKYLKEAIVNLTIELAKKKEKLAAAEASAAQNWKWFTKEQSEHQDLIKKIEESKKPAEMIGVGGETLTTKK